jgi:hypothetical protein
MRNTGADMQHRWFLLDSDVVGDGFRTLCYEDDTLKEAEHFVDRWTAMEHGEQWVYSENESYDR